jgi:tetratricopeptide (TPR) repeat protein
VARARKAITSSALAILCGIAVAMAPARVRAGGLGDRFATDDPRALAEAVTAVERAPATTPELADALYTAARTCEDKLADPVRALALYERLLREDPDAGVARAADHHATRLRTLLGDGHAADATAFARLVADAEHLDAAEVERRGDALATAWAGAPEATLWLAEWLRRSAIITADRARFAAADARYATILATWPDSPQAHEAATGRAGAAIDAHAWAQARTWIAALPVTTAEERLVRADLSRMLARGELRERFDGAARLALVLVFVLLLASLEIGRAHV